MRISCAWGGGGDEGTADEASVEVMRIDLPITIRVEGGQHVLAAGEADGAARRSWRFE